MTETVKDRLPGTGSETSETWSQRHNHVVRTKYVHEPPDVNLIL